MDCLHGSVPAYFDCVTAASVRMPPQSSGVIGPLRRDGPLRRNTRIGRCPHSPVPVVLPAVAPVSGTPPARSGRAPYQTRHYLCPVGSVDFMPSNLGISAST